MIPLRYRQSVLKTAILMAVLLLGACDFNEAPAVQHFYGRALGTSYNVRFVGQESDVRSLQSGTDTALEAVNQSMSTYIDDSELNQFNDAVGAEWFDISNALGEVLAISQSVAERSNGAFDITVGPLVDLWGFGPKARREQVPDPRLLQAVLADVGYQGIVLDLHEGAYRVKKLQPRRIDLSAVAKGYAVDKIAEYLMAQGFTDFLVEVGGEMRLSGLKPDGQAWNVAVETPESGARGVYKIIPLSGVSIATSGDYRNYFEIDGTRYSHTIDPANGYPIRHHLASVTVITASSGEADAWATAMMVMGPDKAITVAEKEQLAVLLIEKKGTEFVEHTSSAFNRLVLQEQ